MATREWTDAQKQCLAANGTVLVSAAAGSGKTAVLIERIIRLITAEESPVDVDQLLVVTFTKAAAAEMKQRLGKALHECLAARPNDRRLRRQLMLLPNANISTVHGFCGNLIREHFHRFPEISPLFRVGEESQTRPLMNEAMDEVLEEAYAADSPAFSQLLDLLGGDRHDKALAERIRVTYHFMQAHPQPARWRESVTALYRTDVPLSDTVFGQEIQAEIQGRLQWYARKLENLAALAESNDTLTRYAVCLRADAAGLHEAADALGTMSWDEQIVRLSELSFGTLSPVRGCTDEELKEYVKNERTRLKTKVGALAALMVEDEASATARTAALAPAVEMLMTLTAQFEARYTEKKTRAGLLDFNDLEHLALRLLTDEDENGTMTPSAVAAEVSRRFVHVMVDEYQDTNPTQECLFSAISRKESNLFFVGDVKQSIYSFRNATPSLFMARQNTYAPFDGETYPALIRLGHNFRSRCSVTETVNLLFSQLMTAETGGVNYRGGEELTAAATYAPHENDAAELILVEKEKRAADDSDDAAEARVIAARISEMMAEGMTVRDGDGERPLAFRDVCVLLRSIKDHAAVYAEELNRAGVPAVTDAGGGFYETQEIALVLSLLRFLDNPLEDVSMLAVMMSVLFAFTPDDLADIRKKRRRVPLYTAVRRRAREDDPLGRRLAAFLKETERLRTLSAAMPAARLLQQVYEEMSLTAVMGARPHGEQRVANLQKLLDIARGFESRGFRGLSAFVRFAERDRKQDGQAPATVVGGENAVRVMSVHASKGLEFPVVFMAAMGRGFNDRALSDPLLLHRTLGVGMDWRDPKGLESCKSVQKNALALRLRRDARAEELRVLYVALTRAKERLCMVATVDRFDAMMKAFAPTDGTVPLQSVIEASSYADWVLPVLLRHPDAAAEWPPALAARITPFSCDTRLSLLLVRAPDVTEEETVTDTPVLPPDERYLAGLKERTAYVYPYKELGNVPVKLAASALAHRAVRDRFVAVTRPAFFSDTSLSPAERGTAMHQFMQFADYAAAAEDIEREIARLVREGFLSPMQGASLSRPRLVAFFKSELYRRIGNAERVQREYAFTVERPVSLCAPVSEDVAAGETVLVQGIADCLFYENGRWIIVDYKTDRVDTPEELVERYRPQLMLYKEALENGLGETVGECLLYSFALQRTVEV